VAGASQIFRQILAENQNHAYDGSQMAEVIDSARHERTATIAAKPFAHIGTEGRQERENPI
jgi:hypothetical protein